MMRVRLVLALLASVAAVLWHQAFPTFATATTQKAGAAIIEEWTTTEDFAQGTTVSMDFTGDQLQLSSSQTDYGYVAALHVPQPPVILRINTNYPASLDPTTLPIEAVYTAEFSPNPSRTAVDSNGNGWVGSRVQSTVQRLGVLELDQCVDFNGDGVITTSARTTQGEGEFPPMLPQWSSTEVGDECITHVYLAPGLNSDVRSIAVDRNGSVWVGSFNNHVHMAFRPDPLTTPTSLNARLSGVQEQAPFQCDNVGGYGAVLGSNGTIWSADYAQGRIMRYNTEARECEDTITAANYGLGIDRKDPNDPDDDVVVAAGFTRGTIWASSNWQANSPSWCPDARGITVDLDGNLWAACSGSNYVVKVAVNSSNTVEPFTQLATVTVGSYPTGMAIDGNGKVWASVQNGNVAVRIEPSNATIDLKVKLPDGCQPYTYGDLSGSLRSSIPTKGSWRVVYDSTKENFSWAGLVLTWSADIPGTIARAVNGSIAVSASSSNDTILWSSNLAVNAPGGSLDALPTGQYLRISALFTRDEATGESPVLDVIRLQTAGCDPGACCNSTTGEALPLGTVCRRAASQCKEDAVCNGVDATCPDENPNRPDGDGCKWTPYKVRPSASSADKLVAVAAHEAAAWLTGTSDYDNTDYPECVGECLEGVCDLRWSHPGCCYVPVIHPGHPNHRDSYSSDEHYGRPYSTDAAASSGSSGDNNAASINNVEYWKSREWFCYRPPTY